MNQSTEVAAWLESYDNPMKDVVRRVREIILRADPRIEEGLEENAPVFSYRGTLASIFPESKKHASLMVARGAEIPGHHPRLEGSNDPARVMKIHDMSDANAARDDLQHLVRAWCDWRDADAAESEAREPRAATKKPAAKKTAARNAKKKTAKTKKAAPKKKATKTQPAAKKASAPKGKKAKSRTAPKTSSTKKSGAPKKAAKRAPKTTQRRGAPRSRGR